MNQEPTSEARNEQAPSAPAESRRAWMWVLAAAALAVVGQLTVEPLVVSHDVGLNLDCGRMMLEGKRPYLDFIDTNPPMIMYVSVLPALLSRLVPLHVILSFHVLMLMALAASAWLIHAVLRRSQLELKEYEIRGATLSVLLLSLGVLVMPEREWGQREHLFLLLYLPFFFCRWVRWRRGSVGPFMAAVVGVLGAVGACFKPYFVVVALMIEAVQWAAARRLGPLLKPDWIAFVLTGLAYGGHFFLLPGEITSEYFTRWAPLVVEGYSAYNQPWGVLLIRPGVAAALAGSLAGLVLAGRLSGALAWVARLFVVLSLVSFALYLFHHKGWSYQLIPSVFGGAMAAACGLDARLHARRKALGETGGLTLAAARWIFAGSILATAVVVGAEVQKGYRLWPDPGVGEIVEQYSDEGDPVLVLTTDVGRVYPLLLQTERRAASRYIWTFPIALIHAGGPPAGADDEGYPYPSRESATPEERRILEELGEDIRENRPPLILMNDTEHPQGLPPGFALPGYFEAVGFLEREMDAYRYVDTAFEYRIYVLKQDRDEGAPGAASGTEPS